MTTVAVKKYVFVGALKEKAKFFEEAQKAGVIHFLNVSESKASGLAKEILDLDHANKVLRGLPVVEQVEPGDYRSAPQIATKILRLKHEIEELEESNRVLELEISRIEPFGQFSLADIAFIEKEGNRKVRFFASKAGHFLELPDDLIFITSDHGLDYYVSISKEPVSHDKLVQMEFHESLQEMQGKVAENQNKIHSLESELKTLAKFKEFLGRAKVATLNVHNLEVSATFPLELQEEQLFAVEGWAPVDKQEQLENLGVYYEEIAVEPGDRVPTFLENTGLARVGEDLVHIYDTPSPNDKDPSLWVLGAFALFFSMIVNDAGYGLVYFAIVAYFWWRYKDAKPAWQRFFKLGFILTATCIVWGVLTASYFGVSLSPDNPLRKYSLLHWMSEKKAEFHLHEKDQTYQAWAKAYPESVNSREFVKTADGVLDSLNRNILLELALVVGIVHLALSFSRYLGRNWNGYGWIMFLIGAFLYFPHYLGETTFLHYALGVPAEFGKTEGLQLIFLGIAVAVVLSIVQNKLSGLAEPMNVIQVFADVLSYLRLYALGLAGAIVSGTINELYGSVPLLVAVVLIVIFHAVNMLLGIMGGVIHGLRLNFLEWYHYSFEGGGKPFDPLRLYDKE